MHGKAADIKRFLLWTALYFIGAVLAARFLRSADGTALFWPSAGVGYVAAVRYGLRWTAVVAVGALLYLLLAKVLDHLPALRDRRQDRGHRDCRLVRAAGSYAASSH